MFTQMGQIENIHIFTCVNVYSLGTFLSILLYSSTRYNYTTLWYDMRIVTCKGAFSPSFFIVLIFIDFDPICNFYYI